MQSLYSNKFSTALQNEEIYLASLAVWDTALKDMSNETIKKAIDDLPNRFPSWPPTPGEFKELCVSYEGSKRFKFASDVLVLAHENSSYKSSNELTEKVIHNGSKICKKLKEIYPDDSYMEIAEKFNKLKVIARSYYNELSDVDVFIKLVDMSVLEIKETLLDKLI